MNYNHFHETAYFHHIQHAMLDNIKKGIEKIEITKQNIVMIVVMLKMSQEDIRCNNMYFLTIIWSYTHVFTKFLNYVFFLKWHNFQ